MLSEPAASLTDLAPGVVIVVLAVRPERRGDVHRHWRWTFWWAGVAALAGALRAALEGLPAGVGLDPSSLRLLAQIPGMVLLHLAAAGAACVAAVRRGLSLPSA